MQTYNLQGSHKAITPKKFQTSSGDYLIIADRNDSAKHKTFMMLVEKGTTTRHYISSLFPNQNGTFNLDFKGIRYIANISSASLDISAR